MGKKRVIKRLLSTIIVLAMVVVSMANGAPQQAQAAAGTKELVNSCINASEKYLYLGGQGVNTYNFNILKEAKEKGATYVWYVKADKGSPNSVTINQNTGVVTAKEAGTAYIRCKITYVDGTILRPEAKVTVRNNITEVEISNLPENLTITAGIATDFNRTVLETAGGKGVKTQGITRWEVADDTAETQNATSQGIVFPINEGEFKIRSVCFQSTEKYKLWLADKVVNAASITATSEWVTIKVASANGVATVTTAQQLNKSLAADSINQITLSTKQALKFTIPKGNYSKKTLIVDAANADVENYGIFKEITINAIKDNTWIEFADGNIIYLKDDVVSIVIDKDVKVKRIVIDKPNAIVNIEIRGSVDQITVTQPSSVNLSGSGKKVPVSIEKTAGGSTITTSMPLQLELKAKTNLMLNPGAEETILDKSESTVEVRVENNTKKEVIITTGNTGGEKIEMGKTVISDETTTPRPTVEPVAPILPFVEVNAIIVTSAEDVTEIENDGTLQMSAAITPANATNQTIAWSVATLDKGNATINTTGLLTGTGVGSVTVTATNVATGVITGTKVITITTPASYFDFDSSTGTITGYGELQGYVVIPTTINDVDVTIIGNSAFRYDYSITNIVIPDTVTIIESYAFQGSASLESVTLPRNLQRIDDGAFANCQFITSIIIPASVTEIGGAAFLSCDKLDVAFFLGNAPTTFGQAVFSQSTSELQGYADFKIYYQTNKTRYDTPTWNGYTCKSYDPEDTYTLTYDGNGNTEGVVPVGSSGNKAADEIIASDKGNLLKDGYIFRGWSKTIDGSVSYQPNQVLAMDAENMTLYALWTKTYTITIDPSMINGTITIDKTSAKEGELIKVTITPDPGFYFRYGDFGDMGFYYGFYMETENVIVNAEFGAIIVTGTGEATTITTNNGTLQMVASSVPADIVSSGVIWAVAPGTGTARISEDGLLTAVSNGTVTVTATSKKEEASDSAVITISNQNEVISTVALLIIPPEIGGTPELTIADGTGYTGTISWITPTSGNFEIGTSPSATIILTADSTHKFTGIAETRAITIAGATSTTYVVSGTKGEILTINVAYPEVAENITGLRLFITAPVAGQKHDLYSTPIHVYSSNVYMYLENTEERLVGVPYVMGNVYKLHCVLYSGRGYKFPIDGFTPTLQDWLTRSINIGTVGDGIVSGGNKSGNTLTFEITLPAAVASSDATLSTTSTVKGVAVTSVGTPITDLSSFTAAGSVSLTEAQAADTSNIGSYITEFATILESGVVTKVVKYAKDYATTNFDIDTAYANEAISNGDFFIIKNTAQDGTTVLYYRITVSVQ